MRILFVFLISSGLPIVPMASNGLCVKSQRANLRTGPDTKFPKSWEVFEFMPLEKIGQKGGWIQVRDVDGERHWVRSDLVTEQFLCAVVRIERGNLRKGPGLKYPLAEASPVLRYSTFRVLSRSKNGWLKVVDAYGSSYWVSEKVVWIR